MKGPGWACTFARNWSRYWVGKFGPRVKGERARGSPSEFRPKKSRLLMPKAKVLLVEDNSQNRVLATFLLEEAGIEVMPAVNGAEGLEKARALSPDLILLDIQLPDIDGY